MIGKQGFQKGKDNPSFGKIKKEPTLCALHQYMRKRVPKPKVCSKCKLKKKLELSSKKHSYTRNIKDWWWLCKKCHHHYDGNEKYLIYGRLLKRKERIIINCLNCKKEIKILKSSLPRKKYCSRKCLMLKMWETNKINHI